MNKEQIDEIALRVAKEIPFDKRTSVEQICVELAHRYLAELAKVSEPDDYLYRYTDYCGNVVLETGVPTVDTPYEPVPIWFSAPLPPPDLVAENERLKVDADKYNKLVHITERGCYQFMYWDTDRDTWEKVSVEGALIRGK